MQLILVQVPLVVKGGLGVAKKLFVGNDTSIAGNLTANNITLQQHTQIRSYK